MSNDQTAPFTGREAGTRLNLSPEAESIMRLDSAEAYPYEACGFFFGNIDGNELYIAEAMPIRNDATSNLERRFAISTEDYRMAEKRAEELELDLLGVYHSHPDHPSQPSEHDLRSAVPGFSYIIVEVRNGRPMTLRSWTLNNERRFDEEPVENVISELLELYYDDHDRLS
jgi:proteasome lid subunit RPN8/RPN11